MLRALLLTLMLAPARCANEAPPRASAPPSAASAATVHVAATAPVAAASSPAAVPLGAATALTFAITPGKPDAPTETISVVQDGGALVLRVQRTGSESGEAALAPDDVRAIADALAPLRGFAPQAEPGQVADFGSRELHVDGAVAKAGGLGDVGTVEANWTAPLSNESAPNALAAVLGRLGREKVPSVLILTRT